MGESRWLLQFNVLQFWLMGLISPCLLYSSLHSHIMSEGGSCKVTSNLHLYMLSCPTVLCSHVMPTTTFGSSMKKSVAKLLFAFRVGASFWFARCPVSLFLPYLGGFLGWGQNNSLQWLGLRLFASTHDQSRPGFTSAEKQRPGTGGWVL